jgi:capsular exopolysaccharide synthesis family protein
MITATLLTYVFSEIYRSSTKILIRPQRSIDLVQKREEILNFPVSHFTPIETASRTYTEIIKSRPVSEKVVTLLGLDKMKDDEGTGLPYLWKKTKKNIKGFMLKTWDILRYGYIREDNAFGRAVTEVQGGLSVKPTKETFLFELQAEAKSPALSSAIANAAAEVFVYYMQEMNNSDMQREIKLREGNVALSNEDLARARNAIAQFKEREGIASLKDQMELEVKSLSGLENSWKSINTEMRGAEAKKIEIIRQLREMRKFSKSEAKVRENPLVRTLQAQLAEKEVKLAALGELYTEDHKQIKTLRTEIYEIKSKLNREPPTFGSEETISIDPVYQDLSLELGRVGTLLKSLRAKSNDLTLTIQERKKRIQEIPQKEAELAKLELIATLNEETHKLLSKDYEEVRIAAGKKAPDVRVIHNAVTPIYPVRPIKVYHTALAGILSLIFGIGIALLREHMNTTIRYADEAEHALKLPVLMTIPQVNSNHSEILPLINIKKEVLIGERRKHERASIRLPIEIRRRNQQVTWEGEAIHLSLVWKGETIDLSPGGVCCYLEGAVALTIKDRVKISHIQGAVTREEDIIEGIILRIEDCHDESGLSIIGIKFLTMNSSSSKKIGKMMGRSQKSNLLSRLPVNFEDHIRGIRNDFLMLNNKEISTILITSCSSQEGKSTIVSNLAASLVEINKKVVLVDANLRSPSLHNRFGVSNRTGLSEILLVEGMIQWEKAKSFLKFLPTGLCVLPSGQPVHNPSSLFALDKMIQVITLLNNNFDITLIDSPPLLGAPESALLASIANGTILVLNAGSTSAEDGQRAKTILERSHARILGTVLNRYQGEMTGYYRRG